MKKLLFILLILPLFCFAQEQTKLTPAEQTAALYQLKLDSLTFKESELITLIDYNIKKWKPTSGTLKSLVRKLIDNDGQVYYYMVIAFKSTNDYPCWSYFSLDDINEMLSVYERMNKAIPGQVKGRYDSGPGKYDNVDAKYMLKNGTIFGYAIESSYPRWFIHLSENKRFHNHFEFNFGDDYWVNIKEAKVKIEELKAQ